MKLTASKLKKGVLQFGQFLDNDKALVEVHREDTCYVVTARVDRGDMFSLMKHIIDVIMGFYPISAYGETKITEIGTIVCGDGHNHGRMFFGGNCVQPWLILLESRDKRLIYLDSSLNKRVQVDCR